LEYFEAAAAKDNLEALNNLAQIYLRGVGYSDEKAKPEYDKVLEIYKKQIALGDPRGHVGLARLYLAEAIPNPNKLNDAQDLLEQAANLNDPNALRMLGEMYASGTLTKIENPENLEAATPDYATAAQYYNQAIELGDTNSMLNLGFLYLSGNLDNKANENVNVERALDLYKRAAEANNPGGLTNIATMYYTGMISSSGQNSEEIAEKLWIEAANAGDVNAERNLTMLNKRRAEQQNPNSIDELDELDELVAPETSLNETSDIDEK